MKKEYYMANFNAAPSATDTSWLRTSSTDRVAQAIADVGASLDKVAEYTKNMFEPEKTDAITTEARELGKTITDPINIDSGTFKSAVNRAYKGEDLEEETTSKLRTIILLQMATDTNGDGIIDTDKYDKNGDGNIDDGIDIEQVVANYISSGVINKEGFNKLLAATLLEFPEKDNLVDYVNGILDDNVATDATSTTDTTTQTPVPAPATTV